MLLKEECNNELMLAFQRALQMVKEYLYNELKKKDLVQMKYEELDVLTSFSKMSLQNNTYHLGELNWVVALIMFIENCILELIYEEKEDKEEDCNLEDELSMLKNELNNEMALCFNNNNNVKEFYFEVKQAAEEIRKIDEEIQEFRQMRKMDKK